MDETVLMKLVSAVASGLALSGAETYRVEESVKRISAAYSCVGQVYAVPHSIIITIMDSENHPVTQLTRLDQLETNLDAVELYSNLSRRICSEKPDLKVALGWVDETKKQEKNYSFLVILLGYVMVAAGFCPFFGGSLKDTLSAGICGLLLGLLSRPLAHTNTFFQKIISAFLMAFLAYGLAAVGLSDHVDATIIGTLMLLVPGLLFTNALRDIILGDTNSGINRIVEVLLIAAGLALGTAAAWSVTSALWGTPLNASLIVYHPVLQCIFAFIACLGFVIVFNIHGKGALLCALGGALTWAVFLITKALNSPDLLCYFCATVFASLYAEVMARIRKYPAISYLIISLMPMIPGAGIYYAAHEAVLQNADGLVSYSSGTLAIAGIMAVGILSVVSLSNIHKNRS